MIDLGCLLELIGIVFTSCDLYLGDHLGIFAHLHRDHLACGHGHRPSDSLVADTADIELSATDRRLEA